MSVTIPSITGGQVERFAPGDRFTLSVAASTSVKGGQVVELTGDWTCQAAGAGSTAVAGVAMHDAGATGSEWTKVAVVTEGIWNLGASGAIAAGNAVVCAGSGKVAPAGTGAGMIVGVAMAAIGATGVGPVKLKL